MNRKVLFVLKLLVGAYLIFVGVTLLRTILDVRPGNQEIMSGIAVVFILVGGGYLIGMLVNAIKSSIGVRDVKHPEEMNQASGLRPERDRSLFRTAPMPILEEKEKIRPGEGHFRERMQRVQTSGAGSATVTLQKVGPDTMVWDNKNNGYKPHPGQSPR